MADSQITPFTEIIQGVNFKQYKIISEIIIFLAYDLLKN